MDETILTVVGQLAATSAAEHHMMLGGNAVFPSIQNLSEIISLVRAVILPDFFDCKRANADIRSFHLGVNVERLSQLMASEIEHALQFNCCKRQDFESDANALAVKFLAALPEIKRLIYTDIEAIYSNDPAVENYAEVILSYPVVQAMIHYRTAHALHTLGVPIIPRIITELAHSATGIDIHPGADIGEHFAIDHGTGVVIGETCIIGNHVTLYQGVTLGAKNFSLDSSGHPMNLPRHPIIEDGVTIYSNSTILGRITVGRNSIIGGNVWLTHSIEPGSRVLQHKATEVDIISNRPR